MSSARARRAALVTAAAVLLAVAPPAQARPPVTATPSATSAVPGDVVTVSGVASAGARVLLQRFVAGRWGLVRRGTAAPDGTYTVPFPPDWYLEHRLRVKDTRTGRVSESFTVAVRPDYTPQGSAKDFSRYRHKGRWNPCKTITWRYNTAGGYDGALSDLKAAFDEITLGSGLRFRYLGTTRKTPTERRRLSHGHIIVDWQSAKQRARMGSAHGQALAAPARLRSGAVVIYAGGVFLSLDAYQEDRAWGYAGADLADRWRNVMVHELGHVVGLLHAEHADQVMHATSDGEHPFGAGDLAGLKAVGATKGCL